MRVPRFILAIALLGTPVTAVAVTATSASAEPFTYTAISVATRGACALAHDGTVVCWGDNPDRWVFPDKPTGMVRTPTKISLPNGLKWKSINSGEAYANCGIAENDRAYCWGNHHIGSYFTPTSRTPIEVEFPADVRVTDVQSGNSTACATTTTAQLWCWGDAHFLGDGSIDPVRVPVRIPMPDNNPIKRFHVGGGGVCAVTTAHNMYCWGSNADGQLGLGYAQQFHYSYSWTPVLIPTPAGEQWDIPSYAGNRLCALTVSGAGYCAGDNYNGSFGNGTYNDSTRFTKMVVPDGERLVSIATGWYHTCVGTESGKMWCFGRGDYGELGTGTSLGGLTWRTPVVPAGVRFVSFDAGVSGTCALDSTGRVWCWGGMNWVPPTPTSPSSGYFPELIPPVGSPTVLSTHTSQVDSDRATVSGRVNPNGYRTTVVAEVSASSTFTSARRITVTATLPDDSYIGGSFSVVITSLEPRTLHYVRLIATNSLGTVTGPTSTFVTLGDVPSVSVVTTSDITGNEATITASFNPNRLTSSAQFEVSQNATFIESQTYPFDSMSGVGEQTRSINLSDLLPNTQYFVRGVATNRLGTTKGETSSFTTVGTAPAASIEWSSSTNNTISVGVYLTTGLSHGEVFAEISPSPSFTSVIRSSTSTFTSRGPSNHNFFFASLSPRTDYWVRVIAANAVGSSQSAPRLQRTRGGSPVVVISRIHADFRSAIADVTYDTTGLSTFVTLRVSPHADMSDATEYFIASNANESQTSTSVALTGLTPRTTYYAEVFARNEAGSTTTPTTRFVTLTPLGIVINNDNNETESTSVQLEVTAPSPSLAYRVSNHPDFKNARVFSPSNPITWELLASDDAEAERIVYVQVYLANGQSVIYRDSITLLTDISIPDEEAPVIETLRATRTSANAQATASSASNRAHVNIAIRDKRSGVTRIEMKTGKRTIVTRVDASRRGAYTIALPKGVRRVQVRVRDAAGNYSRWRTVTVRA